MNLLEMRKGGVGNGFTVSNAKDGYRQDNSLWFGTCDTCGEQVSSSSVSAKFNGWAHTLTKKIGQTGFSMQDIDYCPQG